MIGELSQLFSPTHPRTRTHTRTRNPTPYLNLPLPPPRFFSFAPRYGGGGDTRGPSARLRDIMEGWFLGTKLEDITYEDFRKWLAWAFFEVSAFVHCREGLWA